MKPEVEIYDTTLRDGSQGEGINFSALDKIRIAEKLDTFGIHYIEGGWPGSNPKDMEFFQQASRRKWKHAKIAAFSMTRRKGLAVEKDDMMRQILQAETPVATIVGKTWLLHVHEVLRATPDENIAMIADTIRYLKDHGRTVMYDAEHAFDGYKDSPEYALATWKAAEEAGAECVVLCDTNGGCLPEEIAAIVGAARKHLNVRLGIHTHNDCGLGAANGLAGIRAGATQIQGTINGYGERTGNCNLTSIIPLLQFKMMLPALPAKSMAKLKELSEFVDEIANVRHDPRQPWVGQTAFAHKGGMHVHAIDRVARSYEHINPEAVGNSRRVLVSDMSGRTNILMKATELGFKLQPDAPETRAITAEVKRLEGEGYEYEAAEGSLALLIRKLLKHETPPFTIEGYHVSIRRDKAISVCQASVKVQVDGVSEHTIAEGDGPVNALDGALRAALTKFFPKLKSIQLADYKVRILDSSTGTGARTRVLIESTDGKDTWGTVGVHDNIIEASLQALSDSLEVPSDEDALGLMPEIPKAYEPQAVEEKWYGFWLKENCFSANPASSKPAYSIVIPPPNVTGMLHMGHVLNNTIQDILSRKARMEGKEVLWLPGTDHAGIATQAVVEKTLRKQGVMKHRDDLGRDKFLEHVWAWKEKHGGIIIQQLKKLGCSCDWTRERFTMDPEYSRCVQKVFVELYKKGLIYRGKRMVNWDPAARTALSDEEVEMTEKKGQLWHIKYPLLDDQGQPKSGESVVVATTRPETMLGDEAVAVNPKDPRYAQLVGRKCLLPLRNKAIPIIADDFVDPKFGTGCVKVTPAHDPNDYAMGQRHNLPLTIVIGPDGNMTAEAGEDFDGLDRMEAREAVVEKLTEQGLLLKTEDYVHNVGYSQRSGVPIEPYLSEQWFLKYPSVEASTKAVEENRITFHPERWAKTYSHWMTNLRDWCISRQLWWGHRVPVWRKHYSKAELRRSPRLGEPFWGVEHVSWLADKRELRSPISQRSELFERYATDEPEAKYWWRIAAEDADAIEVEAVTASEMAGQYLATMGLTQDPDVLDTWFSSWLWPFATMGWPGQTDTLKKFYPTTDLVTGPDIIFFWVARMIMAGYEFMGDLPFRNVYFTGIIRDKLGRKMSKSLGNSPDPLELIAKYGADALRFGTMRSAPLGQDVLFDEKDVELGRNFCNKLWNACRFRQMQGGEAQGEIAPEMLSSYDKWILLKLDQAIREITTAFDEYRFNEATQTLYRFFWSEYCDWYVEASKAVLARPSEAGTAAAVDSGTARRRANAVAVIDFVLSHMLRLFHPFLPFITEELWHGMGYHEEMPAEQGGKTIMFAPWPKPLDQDFLGFYGLDGCYLEIVGAKYELITQGRNLRRGGNIPPSKKVKYVFKPAGALPAIDAEVMKLLLNAEALEINPAFEAPKGTPTVHSELGELFLPLEGLVDVDTEKARLKKEIEKITAEIAKAEQKLNNPNFAAKAPPQVLETERQRLADWRAKLERAKAALAALG